MDPTGWDQGVGLMGWVTVVDRFSRHRFSRKFRFSGNFEKIAATNFGSIATAVRIDGR